MNLLIAAILVLNSPAGCSSNSPVEGWTVNVSDELRKQRTGSPRKRRLKLLQAQLRIVNEQMPPQAVA